MAGMKGKLAKDGARAREVDFAYLPTELLLKIFAYVDFFVRKYTLSSVCKNWSAVCSDPSLNRTLRIAGPDLSADEAVEMLADTPSLRKLTLFERSDAHAILRLLSKWNKKLEILRIERCRGSEGSKRLSPSALIRCAKRCRNLEQLTVKDTVIDDCGRWLLYTLGFVLPDLRKLTLVNVNVTLREEEARIIVKCCKKLEEIKILQTQGAQMTDKFVETVSCCLHAKLKVLKINAPFLTDRAVDLLKTCENLRKLHLKYCLRLTDRAVKTISDSLHLTSLDLTMATSVGTEAWLHLFTRDWIEKASKVVVGQCDSVDDRVLEAIGRNCHSLRHLGLAGCVNITENGFVHVVFGCGKITCLDLFYTPARLLKCFSLFPQNMKNLKKLVYRSSCGFQGSLYVIGSLKLFLPDIEIVDTVEKLK